MVDPLNPRLSSEGLIEQIRQQYPNLSREEIVALAEAFGFDLGPSSPPPSAPTKPAARRWKPPAHWVDETSEKAGTTLTVVGAPRSARKPPSDAPGIR